MTTETLTLIDFLLARIAQDEERASLAVGRGVRWTGLAEGVAAHDVEAGWHVLRWQPARALAECEAKRRVIEHETAPYFHDGRQVGTIALTPVLRALAAVYADHPDYNPDWRP